MALWRSFATFDGRCSLRTWVYRVSHNAAASHVIQQKRVYSKLVSIEDLDNDPAVGGGEQEAGRQQALDRQIILSYLEGLDAADIGEITGISPGNAATKIHRIKHLLARRFNEGAHHA